MTHEKQQMRSEQSLLRVLRGLVPLRPLVMDEALRIAELQANRFRQLLGIDGPMLPTEALTELPRIRVVLKSAPQSGALAWDGRQWQIILDAYEPHTRQRFSCAHEFAHALWYPLEAFMTAPEPGLPRTDKAERLADYFAGALLMPKRYVKSLWAEGHQAAEDLARYFDVSPRAMHFRMRQLGIGSTDRCAPVQFQLDPPLATSGASR